MTSSPSADDRTAIERHLRLAIPELLEADGFDRQARAAIAIHRDTAYVSLDLDRNAAPQFARRRPSLEAELQRRVGFKIRLSATAAAKADSPPPGMGRPSRPARRVDLEHGGAAGIGKFIAVASGKGGVGKSTVAVNLAVSLSAMGLAVGILDADIYGPSIPRLLDLGGRKPALDDKKRLIPLSAYGVRTISIGFMVDENAPAIWRGPMVMGALIQLLNDVAWGILDVLVIDLPPGTGDVQLTLAQQAPLSGAVIVSTPQDLALIDARKGLAMFQKLNVPILGVVENMSSYACPQCGCRNPIFGHGGARETAQDLNVPFLGDIALNAQIRIDADRGRPAALDESDIAETCRNIAAQIWSNLQP